MPSGNSSRLFEFHQHKKHPEVAQSRFGYILERNVLAYLNSIGNLNPVFSYLFMATN